jgi:hypothetical protein
MRRLPPVHTAKRLQTGRGRHQPKWLVQDVGEEGGLERFRRPMWPKATFLLGKNWFDPLEARLPIRGCFGAKSTVEILLCSAR